MVGGGGTIAISVVVNIPFRSCHVYPGSPTYRLPLTPLTAPKSMEEQEPNPWHDPEAQPSLSGPAFLSSQAQPHQPWDFWYHQWFHHSVSWALRLNYMSFPLRIISLVLQFQDHLAREAFLLLTGSYSASLRTFEKTASYVPAKSWFQFVTPHLWLWLFEHRSFSSLDPTSWVGRTMFLWPTTAPVVGPRRC